MLSALRSYIRAKDLFAPGEQVGVAVSGGADSVCLLLLLLELRSELGLTLHVVHFDHQLRPDSASDARFAEQLAEVHGLPFHREDGDTASFAQTRRISVELAARELRYAFFDTLLGNSLHKIATAHTRDDQAETVVMKLLRGAGARGLAGIHWRIAREKGEVVRPLLWASRIDIENYLNEQGQEYRTDSTNADPRHTRNRVRRDLVPMLREFNPEVDQAIAQTAEILRAEDDYLCSEAERLLPFVVVTGTPVRGGGRANGTSEIIAALRIDTLRQQPLALRRRLVRLAVAREHTLTLPETDRVLELLERPSNSRLELPNGMRARRLHREIQFLRAEATAVAETPSPVSGVFDAEPIVLSNAFARLRIGLSQEAPRFSAVPCTFPLSLCLRAWRPGDRFHAPYSRAPKKVKEHLQALHLPEEDRACWPVLENTATGEIVWVKGFPPRQLTVGERVIAIVEE